MLLDDAKEYLSRAAETGRLAHAYLVVGSPRGKAAELAVYMNQKLVCKDEHAPCGTCDTCRQIAARTWCDTLWVAPMKKSRIISVDQMRRGTGENKVAPPYLLSWLGETSFSGGWKVAILSNADRMNDAAANAFLKMLEEPPSRTLMFLLTDAPQQILPTIRSRCQRIDIAEPPARLPDPYHGQILEALSSVKSSGPLAGTALAAKLMSVMNTIKDSVETEVNREIDMGDSGVDIDDDEIVARVSSRYKEYQQLFMVTLQNWFRDILILRSGGDVSELNYPEYAENLCARANNVTLSQALANIEHIDGISRQVDKVIPEATVMAYWFDRMNFGNSAK